MQTNNKDAQIANSLNIEPNPPVVKQPAIEVINLRDTHIDEPQKSPLTPEAEADFNKVRDNLKTLSMLSIEAAEKLHAIAAETEQPRAYEVLSTLIHTAVEANTQLVQIHEMKNDLEGGNKKIKEISKSVTNTSATFVGTPSDLMDIIRGSLKPKKEG